MNMNNEYEYVYLYVYLYVYPNMNIDTVIWMITIILYYQFQYYSILLSTKLVIYQLMNIIDPFYL
jgi:hypothetical protein